MSEFLSTDELAALVGCRTNQRMMMIRWLDTSTLRRAPRLAHRHEPTRKSRKWRLSATSGSAGV